MTAAISGDGARRDASFRTVAGLSDPRCHSFEAVNQPGRFLRHAGSVVRLRAVTGGSFAGAPPGKAGGPPPRAG
ncbi:AbfB domain-containing protein, partial [Actinoplanes sandaracinus]|uniref:AbfB domain-containing protein n=1 Tax=Actinoplanes sandaracinus TaxID=3045177 RepID=UPI003898F4A2